MKLQPKALLKAVVSATIPFAIVAFYIWLYYVNPMLCLVLWFSLSFVVLTCFLYLLYEKKD
jgi:hypothetical protein